MDLNIFVEIPDMRDGKATRVSEIRDMFKPLSDSRDHSNLIFEIFTRDDLYEVRFIANDLDDNYAWFANAIEKCAENLKGLADFGLFALTNISFGCAKKELGDKLDVTGAHRIWIGMPSRVRRAKRLFALETALKKANSLSAEINNLLTSFDFRDNEARETADSIYQSVRERYNSELMGYSHSPHHGTKINYSRRQRQY